MSINNLAELYQQHLVALYGQTCRLLVANNYSRLVIGAGFEQFYFRDDNDVPFRLNPYFAQWANLPGAINSYLLIDCAEYKPRLYYYLPEDIWHKPLPIEDENLLANMDVIYFSEFDTVADEIFKPIDTAYIGSTSSCLAEHVAVNPEALLNAMDYQRAYKTPYEQACITSANHRAVIGHNAAAEAFYEGRSEFQIQMAYLNTTEQLENQQPYNSIIALNENASVLHYPGKHLHVPREHRSFLIDAGASCHAYASDISRTYAYQDNEFAELIAGMKQIQQILVETVEVGKSYLQLHLEAHSHIAKLLARFKLINGDAESAVEQGLSSVFFPHGLGHYLGVQVHDKGGWLHSEDGQTVKPPAQHPYLRLTRTIEPEQVFTIEPGLYFIEPLLKQVKADQRGKLINWQKVEQFLPYGGIRIEDNILVKPDGVKNLTRDAGLD